MNALHDLAVRWASREARANMTDAELVIIEYYHQARGDDEKLKAEGAAMELARLRAVEEAARKYVYSGVDNPIGLDALIRALAAGRGESETE